MGWLRSDFYHTHMDPTGSKTGFAVKKLNLLNHTSPVTFEMMGITRAERNLPKWWDENCKNHGRVLFLRNGLQSDAQDAWTDVCLGRCVFCVIPPQPGSVHGLAQRRSL